MSKFILQSWMITQITADYLTQPIYKGALPVYHPYTATPIYIVYISYSNPRNHVSTNHAENSC